MLLLSLLAFAAAAAAAFDDCPDLAPLRTSRVAAMAPADVAAALSGFWYEHGYIDIAQVGASCQTTNGTVDDAAGHVSMDFAVKYGRIPFHITEAYAPEAASGVFVKTAASVPGGDLIKLPTALVDVSPDAYILFSCLKEPLLPPVRELVIAGRTSSMDDDTFAKLIGIAEAQQVPFNASEVHRVNHTGC